MSTRLVLGPSVQVDEPAAVPVPVVGPDATIEILGTKIGGSVQCKFVPAPEGVVLNHPLNVYAFYVTPVASVPAPADRGPDWFFKSGAPNGSADVRHVTDTFEIQVPNVQPGSYFVQTILEFAV